MKTSTTTRPRFSRFTLCLLGLAICVFTWGLQYKLSLYDPPQAVSHELPSAKLLSRDQQRTTTESPLIKSDGVPNKTVLATVLSVFLQLFAILNSLRPPAAFRRNRDAKRPWRRLSQASLNAFFFRPPPVLA